MFLSHMRLSSSFVMFVLCFLVRVASGYGGVLPLQVVATCKLLSQGSGNLLVLDSQVFRKALNHRVTTVSGYWLSSHLSVNGVTVLLSPSP